MDNWIKNSETELLIINSLGAAVIIIDPQFRISFCNKNIQKILGFSPEELIGKSIQVLFHQTGWSKIDDLVLEQNKNKRFQGHMVCIQKSGSPVDLEVEINTIGNNDAEVLGYVFLISENTHIKKLTDQLAYSLREMEFANREMLNVNEELENEIKLRQKVEEELRQQKLMLEKLNNDLENLVKMEVEANREKERMMVIQSRQASMGEILESVAHQWKQPLNTISLLLYEVDELGKDKVADYRTYKERIEEIYGVVQYMSNTIDDFRNFFIPGREAHIFNLADSIRQTSKFLDSEFRHAEIELITDLDETLEISGFQNEFIQVLMNILNNSRDAFFEKRRESPHVIITLRKADQFAVIEIEDNAGGIPSELLPEIFDAYISTKQDGKGTGLGLYIARSIIENKLNGLIRAQNNENGAKFIIQLPLIESL